MLDEGDSSEGGSVVSDDGKEVGQGCGEMGGGSDSEGDETEGWLRGDVSRNLERGHWYGYVHGGGTDGEDPSGNIGEDRRDALEGDTERVHGRCAGSRYT